MSRRTARSRAASRASATTCFSSGEWSRFRSAVSVSSSPVTKNPSSPSVAAESARAATSPRRHAVSISSYPARLAARSASSASATRTAPRVPASRSDARRRASACASASARVRRERKRARRVADGATRRVLVGPSLVGRFAVRRREHDRSRASREARQGALPCLPCLRVVVVANETRPFVRDPDRRERTSRASAAASAAAAAAHPGHRRDRDARRAPVPRPRRARFQRGHRRGPSARVRSGTPATRGAFFFFL